jgi:hypothetical protein
MSRSLTCVNRILTRMCETGPCFSIEENDFRRAATGAAGTNDGALGECGDAGRKRWHRCEIGVGFDAIVGSRPVDRRTVSSRAVRCLRGVVDAQSTAADAPGRGSRRGSHDGRRVVDTDLVNI